MVLKSAQFPRSFTWLAQNGYDVIIAITLELLIKLQQEGKCSAIVTQRRAVQPVGLRPEHDTHHE